MPNHPDKQKIKIIGFNHHNRYYNHHYLSSSSSSSYICHAVGPLVDPFQSHVSISVFKGLPRFLLPVGQYCFITLGNLFRGILFTWCILLLLYSSNLSKIGVTFNSFAICAFVCVCVCVCVCVSIPAFVAWHANRILSGPCYIYRVVPWGLSVG